MKRPTGPVQQDGDVFDICECHAAPMMAWFVEGEWVAVYEIADSRNVVADAAEYRARKANAWMIGCPQCGRVYARGFEKGTPGP